MNRTLGILFYVKRAKIDKHGKAPIYLRITINGKRAELAIKRTIEPDRWNNEAGKVKGTTEDVKSINAYMDIVRSKVYEHQKKLLENGVLITADNLKKSILGTSERDKTLLAVFEYHNKQVKSLIGKEYSYGTYERYQTVVKHLKEFLKWRDNADDIGLKEVNHKFITDFEYYLKTVRDNSHNTAIKYIKNLHKITSLSLANGWLERNPFANYKVKIREVERGFLSEEEIQTIVSKKLHTSRLDQVRDIFIFCCYTGLAYADVKKLNKYNIVMGIDGERWIQTHRTKTDTRSNIPLLPTALAILEKYANHPEALADGHVLPVLSNQKMNAYLKEIADLCGITKNLTMHLARHTFATTVTLTNGVPIESVSRMLGHTNIKTTQHYAKIVDSKVADDMKALREKMTAATAKNTVFVADKKAV